MGNDTLNLTTAEVQTVLSQIEDAISKSNAIMTDLNNQMKILNRNWTGEAADAYYAVFMRFQKTVAANFEKLMTTYKTVYTESASSLSYNGKVLAETVNSTFSYK